MAHVEGDIPRIVLIACPFIASWNEIMPVEGLAKSIDFEQTVAVVLSLVHLVQAMTRGCNVFLPGSWNLVAAHF